MRRFPLLIALLLVTLARGEELTEQNFDHWLEYIAPRSEELRWKDIPWRATLWQAVIEAQQAGKPILLWAMNGHPLGCT